MTGWRDGLGPWTPVLEGDRLYGRGGADDGYAAFASLTAIEALRAAGGDHARLLVLIEASEESGSPDLPAYLDALGDRLGDGVARRLPRLGLPRPTTGCGSPRRCAACSSAELRVEVLTEGVHSGSAGGVVPSSFRILRRLLDRIEDPDTGRVLVDELWCDDPRRTRGARSRRPPTRSSAVSRSPSPATPARAVAPTAELLRARTWEPAIANIAVDGFPPPDRAGNVLRPSTTLPSPPGSPRPPTRRRRRGAGRAPHRRPARRRDGHRRRSTRRRGRLERPAHRRLAATRRRRGQHRRTGAGRLGAWARAARSRSWACSASVPRRPVPHHRRARARVQRPRPQRVPPPPDGPAHHRLGGPRARRPRPPVTAAP